MASLLTVIKCVGVPPALRVWLIEMASNSVPPCDLPSADTETAKEGKYECKDL